MRELEFRAWEIKTKKYLPKLYLNQLLVNMDGDIKWWSCEGFMDISDKFIIEQYIGLLDKDGVKIFEGDVFRLENGLIGVVVFKEGMYMGNSTLFGDRPIKGMNGLFKIIGNIHQDKELLM